MNIRYKITSHNNGYDIVYEDSALNRAITKGEKPTFVYTTNLMQDPDHVSYDIADDIDKIDPQILQYALLNYTPESILASDLIKTVLKSIPTHIDTTHPNYYQYLEVFDVLISQGTYNKWSIANIIKYDKPDFVLKILNHPHLISKINDYRSGNVKALIQYFGLNSAQPNYDGYIFINKFLNKHNTPRASINIDSDFNARLLKTFCINHIKYGDIYEAKKFIERYNFSTHTKKDILKIAKETNSECYEQISTYIQDVNNIRKFITSDINIQLDDTSLLIAAIENNHDDTIKQILDKTIKLCEASQEKGYKYINFKLMLAIANNNQDKITNLIKEANKLCNENQKNFETPLDCAMQNSDPTSLALVALLINKGFDINAQDNNGNTLLIRCIKNYSKSLNIHCLNLAKFLIQKGANVNLANNDKNTALIQMVKTVFHRVLDKEDQEECKKVIKLLLESNADMHAENNNGITAYHTATLTTDLRKKAIVELLEVYNPIKKNDLNVKNADAENYDENADSENDHENADSENYDESADSDISGDHYTSSHDD